VTERKTPARGVARTGTAPASASGEAVEEAWVDRLAALAREVDPPAMDDAVARDLLARATAAGVAESGFRRRPGVADEVLRELDGVRSSGRSEASSGMAAAARWAMAAAAVLAVGGAGWWARGALVDPGADRRPTASTTGAAEPADPGVPRGADPPPAETGAGGSPASREAPLVAKLPTGDRITGTPGAHFDLVAVGPAHRRTAVTQGTVRFEVAPLEGDASFRVDAGDLRVEVRGTVFSVSHDPSRPGETTIRVYEGEVEVWRAGEGRRVAAGGLYDEGAGIQTWRDGPLAAAGRAAAARRRRAAEPTSGAAVKEPGAVDGGDSAATAAAAASPPGPVAGGGARGGPSLPPPLDPVAVRRWIADGDAARALAEARRSVGRAPPAEAGVWREVEGDALRALGRFREAAGAYAAAAEALPRDAAVRAAYLAASLRFQQLGDPAGAVAVLDAVRADAVGASLEERVLGLRARALLASGRAGDARRAARLYLDRHPEGGLAAWAREVVAPPQDPDPESASGQ